MERIEVKGRSVSRSPVRSTHHERRAKSVRSKSPPMNQIPKKKKY